MANQPAGWYYAEGDPPGTQRYWDGMQWQGGPQPMAMTPSYAQIYGESSNAMTALILSILGFICCQLLSPVAWYLGQQELNAIDAQRRDPTNRGTANAAKIVGLIGTVLWILLIVFYIVVIVFAAAGST